MNMLFRDERAYSAGFPADTFVRLADGSQRRIESLNVLDEVVTADGATARVICIEAMKVVEPLFTPLIWGHYHLRAGGGNRLLTTDGYVRLCDLQSGMRVGFPKYASGRSDVLTTAEYIARRNTVKQSRRLYRDTCKAQLDEYYRAPVGKTLGKVKNAWMPPTIKLTYGFGRIVGIFLAEGWTTSWAIHYGFHRREKETLAAEIAATFKSEFHAEARVSDSGVATTRLVVNSIQWARLFEALCSRGAGAKRLHAALCAGPAEFLRGMLTGWIDGDRCGTDAHGGQYGATISRELAINMFDIANYLGLMPLVSTHTKEHTDKKGLFHRHAWKAGWGDRGKPNHGTSQDEARLWRKVRDIKSEPFDGYLFNLRLDSGDSFVTEAIGVQAAPSP